MLNPEGQMSKLLGRVVPEPDAILRSDWRPAAEPLPPPPSVTEIEALAVAVVGQRRWADLAACAGMSGGLFFPERGESTAEAKAVCRGCPVRQECLDDALDRGEKFGVWGGASERERRRMRRGRPRRSNAAEHGSRSMYRTGCRCQYCKQANAAYMQGRRGSAA